MSTSRDCNDRPVFVISAGRSGSTWLQKTLCMHPRLAIWGEHHGFLEPLLNSLNRIRRGEQTDSHIETSDDVRRAVATRFETPSLQIAWAQQFTVEEYRTAIRNLILELFARDLAPGVRWGFKEIRYAERFLPETLLELFPEARFVFLSRDPEQCLRSMVLSWQGRDWRDKDRQQIRNFIRSRFGFMQRQRASFAPFVEEHAAACHVLTYEAMLDRFEPTVAAVFDFVDESMSEIDPAMLKAAQKTVTWPTPDDDELVVLIRDVMSASSTEP